MSCGQVCGKCGYYITDCACPETPGDSLESGVVSGSSAVEIPVATDSTESGTPKVQNVQQKALDTENQAFLDKMGDRIRAWRNSNGKAALPIYKDENGRLWWANREQRKKIAKRKKKKMTSKSCST